VIPGIEAIWLEMKLDKQKCFIVGYICSPPLLPTSWNEKTEHILDTLYVENKEIILLGDLNYNFINLSPVNSKWKKIINTFNLHQLINTTH
jgi:hypothetical protein